METMDSTAQESNAATASSGGRHYPIKTSIYYKVIRRGKVLIAGHGLTINVSTAEIQFKPEKPIEAGSVIEAWMDWPARLENRVGLRLHAKGEIRNVQNGSAVLKMLRHDFRIAPKFHQK